MQSWKSSSGHPRISQKSPKKAGYSSSTWSKLERRQRRLRPAEAVLVARRLGVPVAELFEHAGELTDVLEQRCDDQLLDLCDRRFAAKQRSRRR